MNNEFSFTIRVACFTNVKINNSSLTWRDWRDIKEVTECIWIEEYMYANTTCSAILVVYLWCLNRVWWHFQRELKVLVNRQKMTKRKHAVKPVASTAGFPTLLYRSYIMPTLKDCFCLVGVPVQVPFKRGLFTGTWFMQANWMAWASLNVFYTYISLLALL